MVSADAQFVDVSPGHPLLGEQKQKQVTPSGAMGEDRSLENEFRPIDVESPIPHALTRAIAGTESTYHDLRWAYAFLVNVIGTIIAAIFFGCSALKATSITEFFQLRRYSDYEAPQDLGGWLHAFLLSLGLALLAIGFDMGVLHSFVNCAKSAVWCAIVLTALAWLLAILLLAAFRWTIMATVLALIFLISAWVIFRLRHRFHLGATILKVASVAIKSMQGTIFTSLYMGGLQLAWVLVSLVAAFGSVAYVGTHKAPLVSITTFAGYASNDGRASPYFLHTFPKCSRMKRSEEAEACEEMDLQVLLMLFWLMTMAWGCFVIKSVVTCTVSGSIAAWWSSSNHVKPVKAAFYRATHHSFGTLCKTGVVVNATIILFFIVHHVVGQLPYFRLLFYVAQCSVIYFLDYVVTFAGVDGFDFGAAVRRVGSLFSRHGFTIVGNDVIISATMSFLTLSMLVATSSIPWLSDWVRSHELTALQINILDFFVVFGLMFVVATVLEVVRSAAKAVQVAFLEETHGPELREQLTAAWVKVHPDHNKSKDLTTPRTDSLNTGGHVHAM